jgi:tricorn protease-like protein
LTPLNLSADGRTIAFSDFASNLVPDDTNNKADVFVRDLHTEQTTRVSVSSEEAQGNDSSAPQGLSDDGRYVTFYSSASNLVSDDTNSSGDVFFHDTQTGQTTRVSLSSEGTQANGESWNAALSGNGRIVAFESSASNLVSGDTNNVRDVFVRDLDTGHTTRVSVSSNGTQGNDESMAPTLSSEGRFVAFYSYATNLIPSDTNNLPGIFVHDRQTGQTTRVAVAHDTPESGGYWGNASLSADGRFVAFSSTSSNLVSGDTNDISDVFVAELDCPPPLTPTEEVTPEATPTEEVTPEVTPTEEATPEVTPTAAPTSPANAVPQRNYITTQPITLPWNPVTWAVRYQVQVDTDRYFIKPPIDEKPTAPELRLRTLDPGTYFWRVQAIRANGTRGAWSKIESFTVGMP